MYGGVVVYGPSIALSEVTGFNEWIAILTTGVCCMFYTSLVSLLLHVQKFLRFTNWYYNIVILVIVL